VFTAAYADWPRFPTIPATDERAMKKSRE
jgi:hypothetical protein